MSTVSEVTSYEAYDGDSEWNNSRQQIHSHSSSRYNVSKYTSNGPSSSSSSSSKWNQFSSSLGRNSWRFSNMDKIVCFLLFISFVWIAGFVVFYQINSHKSFEQQEDIHFKMFNSKKASHSHHALNEFSKEHQDKQHQQQQQQQQQDHEKNDNPLSSPSVTTQAQSELTLSSSSSSSSSPWHTYRMPNPALLILTYNRREYLERTVESLVKLSGYENFKLYISQNGQQPDLSDVAHRYEEVEYMSCPRVPLLSPDQSATAYLAQHYKFALNKLFVERNHSHVILLEDDMVFAPDFLTMFEATAWLLDNDDTIFCISSWNDNGRHNLVVDQSRLFRTDYFPGLGWMLNRELWINELAPIWPLDQWDHFVRLDTVIRDRDCLVPEVSRNHNIGEQGTNMGSGFYDRYLAPIALADYPVQWRQQPLDAYLYQNYTSHMRDIIRNKAEVWGSVVDVNVQNKLRELIGSNDPVSPVIIPEKYILVLYHREEYDAISQLLEVLNVPRAAHRGTLTVRRGNAMIIFADVRISDYLPDSLMEHKNPDMRIIASGEGESCQAACSMLQMRCLQDHFQHINKCSALMKQFPCEKGCRGGVSGPDIPNYVSSINKQELYQYCLTTEDDPQCMASHWSAQRLCPCAT